MLKSCYIWLVPWVFRRLFECAQTETKLLPSLCNDDRSEISPLVFARNVLIITKISFSYLGKPLSPITTSPIYAVGAGHDLFCLNKGYSNKYSIAAGVGIPKVGGHTRGSESPDFAIWTIHGSIVTHCHKHIISKSDPHQEPIGTEVKRAQVLPPSVLVMTRPPPSVESNAVVKKLTEFALDHQVYEHKASLVAEEPVANFPPKRPHWLWMQRGTGGRFTVKATSHAVWGLAVVSNKETPCQLLGTICGDITCSLFCFFLPTTNIKTIVANIQSHEEPHCANCCSPLLQSITLSWKSELLYCCVAFPAWHSNRESQPSLNSQTGRARQARCWSWSKGIVRKWKFPFEDS